MRTFVYSFKYIFRFSSNEMYRKTVVTQELNTRMYTACSRPGFVLFHDNVKTYDIGEQNGAPSEVWTKCIKFIILNQ